MKGAQLITLFTETSVSPRGPSVFLVSGVAHAMGIGLLLYGLHHIPRVIDAGLSPKYPMRYVSISRSVPPQWHAGANGLMTPGKSALAPKVSGGGQAAAPPLPEIHANQVKAAQTLVLPDVPPNILLQQETPLPMLVLWTQEIKPVTKVVPSPPQEKTSADVKPSLESPNQEAVLVDRKITPSIHPSEKAALPAGSTAPIAIHNARPVQQVPETTSQYLGEPTPATVLSISNLQMPEGTVLLPMANQTTDSSSNASMTAVRMAARLEKSPGTGNSTGLNKRSGPGVGESAKDRVSTATNKNPPVMRVGVQSQAPAGSKLGAESKSTERGDSSSGSGDDPSTERIVLPRNGQFGAVVVGASAAEEFPEAQEIFTDRLAYTVYLHVGLPKTWILQYCLPRSAEMGGSTLRPEAPWPYEIVRPRFKAGELNAEALLIHGFVNTVGHFEQLAVVFPPNYAPAKVLLESLEKWRFRPATQQGQPAAVEVLLIVPETSE